MKTSKQKNKNTFKLILFSLFVILMSTTGCIEDFTIHGNGIEGSEGRITVDFDEVKSEGAFDVHITNGAEYEVIVNAETNILPYIETHVSGNTLRIYIRGLHNVRNRLPMEVFITTPFLEGIKQSGSGIITTDYFVADDFEASISGSGIIETAIDANTVEANISGSGNLFLSGEALSGDFTISGSGKVDAYDMDLRDCSAKISGSGNMWVKVERFLLATISGSGNIFYVGNPDIELHVSGTGSVINEN